MEKGVFQKVGLEQLSNHEFKEGEEGEKGGERGGEGGAGGGE